jgi:hypothetical protein
MQGAPLIFLSVAVTSIGLGERALKKLMNQVRSKYEM